MKTTTNLRNLFKSTISHLARRASSRLVVRKRRRRCTYERQFALYKSLCGLPFVCTALFITATAAHATMAGRNDAPGSSSSIIHPVVARAEMLPAV
ncbi:MAG: hypothetical protein WDN28_34035 [Chthoniobacter sp.]